jgi:hypothetical protein
MKVGSKKCSEHSALQTVPAGLMVTVPLPVPAVCTAMVKTAVSSVAVLFAAAGSGSTAVTFCVLVTVPSCAFAPMATEMLTVASKPGASEPMAQVTIPLE